MDRRRPKRGRAGKSSVNSTATALIVAVFSADFSFFFPRRNFYGRDAAAGGAMTARITFGGRRRRGPLSEQNSQLRSKKLNFWVLHLWA